MTITIPVKAKPQDPECVEEKDFPLTIVAPHLLTCWLLRAGRLRLDAGKCKQFWEHLQKMKISWMINPEQPCEELARHTEPVSLYADEAEYSVSKEKLTALILRIFLADDSALLFSQ